MDTKKAPTRKRVLKSIDWPCDLATDKRQEQALAKKLTQFTRPPSFHCLAWDLEEHVRRRIANIGYRHQFTEKQTFALRRNMLKKVMGMKPFMSLNGNSGDKQNLIGRGFERIVEQHLRSIVDSSVIITTEDERKARAHEKNEPYGPTPDFTFDPPIRINNRRVNWLDAKMLYASCCFMNWPFLPESRFEQTAHKYNAAFGQGAFLLAGGFCQGLADVLTSTVGALLLDATPIDLSVMDAVIESGRSSKAFTFEEMRDALGILPPPPREPPPPPPPNSVNLESITASECLGEDTSREHDWNGVIRCGGGGPTAFTYHYHVCNRCGKEGIRKKVSNKKAMILSSVPCA